MAVTVGIASGKGGVGKTTLTILLGLTSAFYKKRTLIVDTDVGMGNVNIIIGKGFKTSIINCLTEGRSLEEAIINLEDRGFPFLDIIPSGNMEERLLNLNKKAATFLLSRMGNLFKKYDVVIFDLGAGANTFLLNIFSAVDYPVLVVNPEPPSIVDAYSLMKLTHLSYGNQKFYYLLNFYQILFQLSFLNFVIFHHQLNLLLN